MFLPNTEHFINFVFSVCSSDDELPNLLPDEDLSEDTGMGKYTFYVNCVYTYG